MKKKTIKVIQVDTNEGETSDKEESKAIIIEKKTTKKNDGTTTIIEEKTTSVKPLYVVDGVIVENISGINEKMIDNVSVLKGESAKAIYGEKGKDGVVVITTKKNGISKSKTENSNITIRRLSVDSDKSDKSSLNESVNNPLIFVDGVEISNKEMKDIDPKNIESVSVLKDKSATSVYGEKGNNGVVLITMKKGESGLDSKNEKTVTVKSNRKSEKISTNLENFAIFIDGKPANEKQMN